MFIKPTSSGWGRIERRQKTASEAGLLNKSSCLAAALGVTKIIAIIVMYRVTLCCPAYKPTSSGWVRLERDKRHHQLQNKKK
jgi:hypothetical protein